MWASTRLVWRGLRCLSIEEAALPESRESWCTLERFLQLNYTGNLRTAGEDRIDDLGSHARGRTPPSPARSQKFCGGLQEHDDCHRHSEHDEPQGEPRGCPEVVFVSVLHVPERLHLPSLVHQLTEEAGYGCDDEEPSKEPSECG
jgi:hypothetical protein